MWLLSTSLIHLRYQSLFLCINWEMLGCSMKKFDKLDWQVKGCLFWSLNALLTINKYSVEIYMKTMASACINSQKKPQITTNPDNNSSLICICSMAICTSSLWHLRSFTWSFYLYHVLLVHCVLSVETHTHFWFVVLIVKKEGQSGIISSIAFNTDSSGMYALGSYSKSGMNKQF